MEVKEEKNQKNALSNMQKKTLMIIICLIVIGVVVVLFITNKEGDIKTTFKSSLDRIVEKSDLETVNFTYNVIAKQCKDNEDCDLSSNNIKDFEYVVSCQGTLTAGIDFSKVEIDVDKTNKTIIVTMPAATIKGSNVGSLKFLDGKEIPANELPKARELCEKAIETKSREDGKLLPAAKEQASVVLKSLYEQWLKAFDNDYKVEVK